LGTSEKHLIAETELRFSHLTGKAWDLTTFRQKEKKEKGGNNNQVWKKGSREKDEWDKKLGWNADKFQL